MSSRGFDLSDLEAAASELKNDGHPAAAEAKVREGLATFRTFEAPSTYEQSVGHSLEVLLIELLLERSAFDEAEVILLRFEAAASTPLESFRACDELVWLEEKRGNAVAALERQRKLLAIAEAGGDALGAQLFQALQSLGLRLREAGLEAEAMPFEARALALQRQLLREFFKSDKRAALQQLRSGVSRLSDDALRMFSHGAVTDPITLDADGRPTLAGLRSCRNFGPLRDHECLCGKYRGPAHRGVVCEKCGVEVILSEVRSTRPGHLELGTPVLHPRWRKVVTELTGLTERAFLELPERKEFWRDFDFYDAAQSSELGEFLHAHYLVREQMLLQLVPVFPPEGPLPVDRAALERCYVQLLEAGQDAVAVQRAVDGLFALFA